MPNRVANYPIPETCSYCNSKVIYTSNKEIYGKKFGNGKCYKCTECDAYVGVHDGTNIPLGRIANKELRTLKKKAHALFDPIWKNGEKKRGEAYGDLAKKLGIPKKECHFGWFDKEMLEKAIEVLNPTISKQPINDPKQVIEESNAFLKKDNTLTDEWGLNFIKNLVKFVNEGKTLTEKQLVYLNKQYIAIKKNANKKGITL